MVATLTIYIAPEGRVGHRSWQRDDNSNHLKFSPKMVGWDRKTIYFPTDDLGTGMRSVVITPRLAKDIGASNSTLSSMKNVTTNAVLLKQFEDLARIAQAAPAPRVEVTVGLTFPFALEEVDTPATKAALIEGLANALHPEDHPDEGNERERKRSITVRIIDIKRGPVDKNNPADRTTVTFGVMLPKRRNEGDAQMTREQLVRTIKDRAANGDIVQSIRAVALKADVVGTQSAGVVAGLMRMSTLPAPIIVPSPFERKQADARAKGAAQIAHYTQKLGPTHVDTIRAKDNQEQLLKRQADELEREARGVLPRDRLRLITKNGKTAGQLSAKEKVASGRRNSENLQYYLQLWLPPGTIAIVDGVPTKVQLNQEATKGVQLKETKTQNKLLVVQGSRVEVSVPVSYTVTVPAVLSRPTIEDIRAAEKKARASESKRLALPTSAVPTNRAGWSCQRRWSEIEGLITDLFEDARVSMTGGSSNCAGQCLW